MSSHKLLIRLMRDESAMSAVEYGLICGLIVMTMVAALSGFAQIVSGFAQIVSGFAQIVTFTWNDNCGQSGNLRWPGNGLLSCDQAGEQGYRNAPARCAVLQLPEGKIVPGTSSVFAKNFTTCRAGATADGFLRLSP